MNIPLERKRRPGRPKNTAKALVRQPNETQKVNDLGISSCDDSDTETTSHQPCAKKRRIEVNVESSVRRRPGRPAGSKNKKR